MFSYLADKLNVKNLGEIIAPTLTPEQELHAAIENGLEDKFFYLLDEANVDPNAPNSGGHLPIHTAAYHGRVKMIENLLDRGMDVNTVGPRENTLLHLAASQGHEEAARFLINRGANPAVRNRNGRTPYDVAKGDRLRQFLLPLQFRHEDPSQAAAMVPAGITPTVDPMIPRTDIAPPPTGASEYMNAPPAEPQAPQHHLYMAATHSAIPRGPSRITRGEYRPIRPDGFGTSVGNEELTAKFGNTREIKVTAPPPMIGATTAAPAAPAAPVSTSTPGNPFSARTSVNPSPPRNPGGYPGYPPASGPPSGSGPRGAPQFKIFNPKLAGNSGTLVPGAAPRGPVQTFGGPPSSGPMPPSNTPAPYGSGAPPAMTFSEAPHASQAPQSQGPFMESDGNDPPMEEVNLSASANVMQ